MALSKKQNKVKRSKRKRRKIYCLACGENVYARLTTGKEIYPDRQDLHHLPFWKCDTCQNYVGCHHKTSDRTRPLGNIPSPQMRKARGHIHRLMDEILEKDNITRQKLYAKISKHQGREYHTAELCSIEEARNVYRFLKHYQRDRSR